MELKLRRWHLITAIALFMAGCSAYSFYLHFFRALPYGAWYAPLCWLATPLLTTLSAYGVHRVDQRARRARRQRLGLCRQCGYDLRASAERCPECGTIPKVMP